MKNVIFRYEYRDAANYHKSNQVVFSSNSKLDLAVIDAEIRKHLFDDEYFYPDKLFIPEIEMFDFDPQCDHFWYTYLKIEFTIDPPTDKRTFQEFLSDLEKFARKTPDFLCK
ncbi:MAG: hypothetical protein ACOZCO_16640 [Bacteroidota bacterium]